MTQNVGNGIIHETAEWTTGIQSRHTLRHSPSIHEARLAAVEPLHGRAVSRERWQARGPLRCALSCSGCLGPQHIEEQ